MKDVIHFNHNKSDKHTLFFNISVVNHKSQKIAISSNSTTLQCYSTVITYNRYLTTLCTK